VRITVLGGSGFLGSHVADHLADSGHEVVIFDRDRSKWMRPDQTMVEGDILNYEAVAKATEGSEAIFNFAAIADIDEAKNSPSRSAEINILGNINALRACHENNVRRFVLASTLYVYSDAGSFYRCTKQAAESYTEEFWNEFGVAYTILRYGSLYGPRSDARNGLRQMVTRAVSQGELSYVGSPSATREYIHVDDAAAASVACLAPEFANRQLIISGQQTTQVKELLEMLAEILGMDPASILFHDASDPGHYVRTPYAHRSKLAKKLIPNLAVDLGQGLVELVRDIEREVGRSKD
jgi:UDP-glucose 4-epimerase